MGCKSQDLENRKRSRKTLKTIKQTPVLHNSVRGEDHQFDQCWEDTIHGRATKENEETDDVGTSSMIPDQTNIQVHMGANGHITGPQILQEPTASAAAASNSGIGFVRMEESRRRDFSPDMKTPIIEKQFMPQFDRSKKPSNRKVSSRAHTTIQNLLTIVSEQEMEIEKLRQRLVGESSEFNVVDAFRKLDTQACGQVTKEQMSEALRNEIRADFEQYELDLFYLHFNRDNCGVLKYSEFCEAFVPKSQQC